MRPIRFRSPRTSAPDAGFTIIEVAVTTSILMVVIVSLLGVFISAQRSQAYVADRAQTLDDLRIAMDRLTKELRQATVVASGATATSISVQTYIAGATETIGWAKTGETLYRTDDWGGNIPLLAPVTNSDIFTYSPSADEPLVITVRLETRPRSSPDILLELTSEVRLRNQ